MMEVVFHVEVKETMENDGGSNGEYEWEYCNTMDPDQNFIDIT